MPEVQKHGFTWQNDLLMNVYGATQDELNSLAYTEENDLPGSLNKQDPGINLSIKTSCSKNTVCMADCLRLYDLVKSGRPIHMTVIYYKQDDTKKKILSITEVDLTNSVELLFGSVTREQILELDAVVKSVPQKRNPTLEERHQMYSIRNSLSLLSKAIHFDIKCNSQQSRLQCSFNSFQQFLKENPERIIAQSTSAEFRGKTITAEIVSSRRVFR